MRCVLIAFPMETRRLYLPSPRHRECRPDPGIRVIEIISSLMPGTRGAGSPVQARLRTRYRSAPRTSTHVLLSFPGECCSFLSSLDPTVSEIWWKLICGNLAQNRILNIRLGLWCRHSCSGRRAFAEFDMHDEFYSVDRREQQPSAP